MDVEVMLLVLKQCLIYLLVIERLDVFVWCICVGELVLGLYDRRGVVMYIICRVLDSMSVELGEFTRSLEFWDSRTGEFGLFTTFVECWDFTNEE